MVAGGLVVVSTTPLCFYTPQKINCIINSFLGNCINNFHIKIWLNEKAKTCLVSGGK